MAMIVGAFARRCSAALDAFAASPACESLGVEDDVGGLAATLARLGAAASAVGEGRRLSSAAVDRWVGDVKDALYELDDLLDECAIEAAARGATAIGASPPPSPPPPTTIDRKCGWIFSCFMPPRPSRPPPPVVVVPTRFRHVIGDRISELDDRLKEILSSPSAPSAPAATVHADLLLASKDSKREYPPRAVATTGAQIHKVADHLVKMMLKESKKKVDVFAIVGAAGIGKTELARQVFSDERIADNFPIRVWVNMATAGASDSELIRVIARCADPGSAEGRDDGDDDLVAALGAALSKRFIIVLDDVRRPDVWGGLLKDALNDGVARGRFLITARDGAVVDSGKATVHRVERMSPDDGWALLRQAALAADGREDSATTVKEVGARIVEKCGGNPLAIKVVAGVLRGRETSAAAWEAVLSSGAWSVDRKVDVPPPPPALFVGFDDLSPELKQCFLYCALYPEHHPLKSFCLVRQWVAEGLAGGGDANGLAEDLAEEQRSELIRRNLLIEHPDDSDLCFPAHELLRSLARSLVADECAFIAGKGFPPVTPKPRRLAVTGAENTLEEPLTVKQQRGLRALLLFNCSRLKSIDGEFIRAARRLRTLDLSGAVAVESLPASISELVHLRYLNLDGTAIGELPLSVGALINLQVLSLNNCKLLSALPASIGALLALRCLCLAGTPLRRVPKGLAKLKRLNHLVGLVIGDDDGDAQNAFDLADLRALAELRYLQVGNVERASSGGARLLENKPFLRELSISEQETEQEKEQQNEDGEDDDDAKEDEEDDVLPSQEQEAAVNENAEQIERTWDELSPSRSLERLMIKNFSGRRLPRWLMAADLAAEYRHLAVLELDNCRSSAELPPLGVLPELRSLVISGADSVLTVGPEFLLPAGAASPAFPKLELLRFQRLKSWQEWSSSRGETELFVFPRLKSLEIRWCPRLKALPECLKRASALETLRIESAHSLTEVADLPHLSEELEIKDGRSLLWVARLPALRSLAVDDCAKLKRVEGVDALERLILAFPPSTETFYFEELVIFWSVAFPRWLEAIVGRLRRLEIRCSMPLLQSCMEGGKNWHIVRQVPEVRVVSSDGRAFVRYSKGRRRVFDTNVQVPAPQ